MFTEHGGELIAFGISFLVIWTLWLAHHRTMEYFRAYDGVLLWLTMVWLATIVVLPFTTQLLASDLYDRGAASLYIAILLLSALSLLGTSWRGRRHRELLHADQPEVEDWLDYLPGLTVAGILLLTLALSILLPRVGTFPLLLLLVNDPINVLVLRLLGKPVAMRRR